MQALPRRNTIREIDKKMKRERDRGIKMRQGQREEQREREKETERERERFMEIYGEKRTIHRHKEIDSSSPMTEKNGIDEESEIQD